MCIEKYEAEETLRAALSNVDLDSSEYVLCANGADGESHQTIFNGRTSYLLKHISLMLDNLQFSDSMTIILRYLMRHTSDIDQQDDQETPVDDPNAEVRQRILDEINGEQQ